MIRILTQYLKMLNDRNYQEFCFLLSLAASVSFLLVGSLIFSSSLGSKVNLYQGDVFPLSILLIPTIYILSSIVVLPALLLIWQFFNIKNGSYFSEKDKGIVIVYKIRKIQPGFIVLLSPLITSDNENLESKEVTIFSLIINYRREKVLEKVDSILLQP